MKAPENYETYGNEKWAPVVEAVTTFCQEIADDPMRSNHVKVRTMKQYLKPQFPELSHHQMEHYLGAVLAREDFAKRWGKETYELDLEELQKALDK